MSITDEPVPQMVSHPIQGERLFKPVRGARCECGRHALPVVPIEDLNHVIGYWCPEHGHLHHTAIVYEEDE